MKTHGFLKVKIFLLAILLMALSFHNPVRSSHLAALEMSLVSVGGNDYLARLTFYRDCSGIYAPQTVSLYFECLSNLLMNFSLVVPMKPGSGQEVTPVCPGINTYCSNGFIYGMQEYAYEAQVTLPPCNFWRVRYSLCCRNPSNTIQNATSQSAYIEATINNLHAPSVSSPVFSNHPVTILRPLMTICQNPGVSNAGSDSISYTLVAPFTTNSLSYVPYIPPYSEINPLPSIPPVSLNQYTGELCITPAMVVIAPLSIRVDRWRVINDTARIVATAYRDMRVNAILSPNHVPVLSGMDTSLVAGYDSTNTVFSRKFCAGENVTFAIWGNDKDVYDSLDPGSPEKFSISWNQGVPQASFTVHNQDSDSAWAIFSWNTSLADARNEPYCFIVRITDQSCPYNLSQDYTYCLQIRRMIVDLGPDTAVCAGETAIITANADTTAALYIFSINGIPQFPAQVSNEFTLHTAGLSPGWHEVSVQVYEDITNMTCPGVDTIRINVLPKPNPFLGNDTAVHLEAQVILDAGAGYASYLWSTGATTHTIQVDSSGTGLGTATIWVVVTHQNGCIGTDTINIRFDPNPGINKSETGFKMRIVPNPSSGNPELFLENYPDRSITLEIFSNDGKRVHSESIFLAENQARLTIDAGHLAEGSYILKVSGQGGTISGKMIIIH